MSTKILVVGFALLLTTPVLAREKTDVLVMRNGERMTCEIKGLSAGVRYVSFAYIDGTASVDWSMVARVESSQLFVVKTESGTVYTGTLESADTAAGRPVKIRVIQTPEKGAVVERSQIVKMVGTSDKFWERFNGAISAGVIYSKGNQSTQYTFGSEAAYVRERWGAQSSFDSNLSSSAGVKCVHPQLAPSRRMAFIALEELVLFGTERLSPEFRAGYLAAEHARGRNRTLFQEYQSHEHLDSWGSRLAKYHLSTVDPSSGAAKSRHRIDHRGSKVFSVQQNQSQRQRGSVPGNFRSGAHSCRHQCLFLRQALQRSEMECHLVRQLGQPTTDRPLRQRLWNQFRAHLDLRPEVSNRRPGDDGTATVCAPSLSPFRLLIRDQSRTQKSPRNKNQLHRNWYF